MIKKMRLVKILSVLTCFLTAGSCAANDVDPSKIEKTVDNVIRPLMRQHSIPGLAIALTINGEDYFYNYGVAFRETQEPITSKTLFEIGSISKTFTAILASYAQVNGNLSLSDSASKYLPALRGTSFDNISLINLGTYTSGGLPLQVPDKIHNTDQLMNYFKHWQPTYSAGTRRLYSNPSIGMLGMIAAKSMKVSFEDAIEKMLFPKLGMTHSYINVPADQTNSYAQGYTKNDAPIRVNLGVLASETYGVKSNTADMIQFIKANMRVTHVDGKLQRAMVDTHIGYFRTGEMTQGLVWEQYPYPVDLKRVLAGNSDAMVFQAVEATRLSPPLQLQTNAMFNKTGSTNGFAAYAAFVPAKKIGIVILANKNYPIAPRVTAAYQILTQLDGQNGS